MIYFLYHKISDKTRLAEVLKVVDEVRQLPASVDGLAGDSVGSGHRPRSAAEHSNFADLQTQLYS